MKNKKSIIVAVVFILLVVLYFILSTSSCGTNRPETPDAEQTAAALPVESSTDTAPTSDPSDGDVKNEDASAESTAQPETTVVVLENEGDLEIIVPEGMDQDGF